ncbi:MAG: fibronectin type III domain-containing protein, partial [Spirochaetales bacterium]|nr:fibronectin type III domain-containing protein [Spirochaetales bacterium]
AFTTPMFLGGPGTRVTSVGVNVHEPGRTAVRTWYRLAEGVVSDDLPFALDTPWRELPTGGELSPDERGARIQLRFDLLADAERRESPRVRSTRIAYRPELPPPTPRLLRGVGIPGGVEIAWDPVVTEDLAGYRVYFGERPRRYIGTADRISPVDVGLDTTFRIEGLRPDGAYVFAVESYDVHGRRSRLSSEVQVRAGRRER